MPPSIPPQTLKRINRELLTIRSELPEGILSIGPKSDADIYDWQGSIAGPSGSCYEHGVFHFNILLPYDYPFHPPRVSPFAIIKPIHIKSSDLSFHCLRPQVSFKTQIFHPNINPQGAICLDILTHKWSPALSIQKVLLSIICLLTDPNPQDPLVRDIAKLYIQNRSKFEATAKQWVELYARPPPPAPMSEKPKEVEKPNTSTHQKSSSTTKPVVIDLDDDEIEVVPTSGQKQSLQTTTTSTSTTSRKRTAECSNALQPGTTSRKRSGDYNNTSSNPSSVLSSSSSSTPTASQSNLHQAKRPRNQIIELD
ncbi:hypothetical protein KEM48_001774 [Puccinia striiformis f. sp. tritici PST-130]|nr:hypothetical protein H4Q26_001868 [Puccinia striiformis f. sp. tritici PST-130]KAI9606409.1 hypothetical protein KEM48_001774 [Puccinia striiformis f. sp. tritici PST-130]